MKIKIKLLSKFYSPNTSFYEVSLPNKDTLYERIDEKALIAHRGSERDVITKLAMEFADSKGLKNLDVEFV